MGLLGKAGWLVESQPMGGGGVCGHLTLTRSSERVRVGRTVTNMPDILTKHHGNIQHEAQPQITRTDETRDHVTDMRVCEGGKRHDGQRQTSPTEHRWRWRVQAGDAATTLLVRTNVSTDERWCVTNTDAMSMKWWFSFRSSVTGRTKQLDRETDREMNCQAFLQLRQSWFNPIPFKQLRGILVSRVRNPMTSLGLSCKSCSIHDWFNSQRTKTWLLACAAKRSDTPDSNDSQLVIKN